MTLRINGITIDELEIRREQLRHQDATDPVRAATTAVILRHLLLAAARDAGMDHEDDDACIDALLEQQTATLPVPDEAACRAHYDANRLLFRVGERLEVEHILFRLDGTHAAADVRLAAETTLRELQAQPARFAELARARSHCPSAADGGKLGQLVRGASIPEFENVVFGLEEGTLLPRVLQTRFGLHLVRVVQRIGGEQLEFDAVAAHIAETLRHQQRDAVWRRYLSELIERSDIEGFDLTPVLD